MVCRQKLLRDRKTTSTEDLNLKLHNIPKVRENAVFNESRDDRIKLKDYSLCISILLIESNEW